MNISRHVVLGSLCVFYSLLPGRINAQTRSQEDTSLTLLQTNAQEFEPGPFLKVRKDRSVTSFSTVSGAALSQTPVANITNTLYGRLQGLTVEQGSGEPGYDNATLSIRGRGTYDNAGLVIVVDGFQTNSSYFSYLSSVEIESISVLKDPAVLASFGMKGANGILWVVTKRGVAGKPKVQARVVTGWQSAMNLNKPYGSYDYARLYNQAVSNDNYAVNGYQLNWSPRYTDAELETYKNGTGTNVDWYNEVLKKNSFYTNANVLFSGGDPNVRYALILDYMKQGGLYNVPTSTTTSNAQIQRYNIRSNIDFNFFKIFEAKVDLGGRIEDRRYPNINGPALWSNLANYPSNIYPVKDVTGNWSGTSLFPGNPAASINALGWTSTHDRTLQANFSLKEKLDFITPGLYLNEAVSFNTWNRTSASKTATYARYFNGASTTTDRTTDIISNGVTPVNQYEWKQANLTAGYDRTFGVHDFTGAINYYGSSYIVDNGQHPAAGQNRGINIFYNFQNIGGRLHYTYNSRYIIEAAFGWSGSDNFAPENRWGFYPAVALGWIVSNENFLKNNNAVSLLKLRASAGQSAMDQSNQGRYLFQQYFVGSGTYYTGNSALNSNNGIVPSYTANPDIFAEKSTKYNVGLDVTLFRQLSLTIDAFKDNRSGIVTTNRELSALYGVTLPFSNIGKVTNSGFEIGANFAGKAGAVGFNIGGMAAYAKNKIVYQAELPPANEFNKTTGLAIGTPMGLVSDGFYDISDFTANGTLKAGLPAPQFGAVQPGDIKYKDLDGNNKVDQNDITEIGKPAFPTLTYAFNLGLNYKGFDLSALFQGAAGNSINILSAANSQMVAFVNNTNVFPVANNAWAYFPAQGIDTRATADYPRLTTRGNENNYRNSTFWMKKGNYVRLRNIEMGYNLPASVLNKVRLEKLRIYVSAVNALSWSSLEKNYNIDPETFSGYPGLKSFNTGVLFTF
jgi:TonB-linked SusC/RagA family outer membrane protein